jgi:hypothetical protein
VEDEEKEKSLQRCRDCDGAHPKEPDTGDGVCAACHGKKTDKTGYVCAECGGTGRCLTCNGFGTVEPT